VDLEKTYDRLRWDFIRDTLMDVGLPTMFIELIMKCIETASLQILWNGYLSQLIGENSGYKVSKVGHLCLASVLLMTCYYLRKLVKFNWIV
jgi:hypothetical protein